MREREMSKIRRGGIEKETIESIKAGVDLAALVRAKGVKLRKNGKSYFGLCPFHGDKNPSFSVNLSNNLYRKEEGLVLNIKYWQKRRQLETNHQLPFLF